MLISALKAAAAIKQTGASTVPGGRGKSGPRGQDGSHWDAFVVWNCIVQLLAQLLKFKASSLCFYVIFSFCENTNV